MLDISRRINRAAVAFELGMKEAEFMNFINFLADPEIDLINYKEGIITTDRTQENLKFANEERKRQREYYRKRKGDDSSVETDDSTIDSSVEIVDSSVENIQKKLNVTKLTKESGGSYMTTRNLAERPPVENLCKNQPPPPPLLLKIKESSKAQGFTLDDQTIHRAAIRFTDPSWFDDPFTYPEFVTGKIRERYRDYPQEQIRRLFIDAILKWDNLIEDFPAWREEQTSRERKEREHTRKREALTHPPSCSCGGTFTVRDDYGYCPTCRKEIVFDNAKVEWVFVGPP